MTTETQHADAMLSETEDGRSNVEPPERLDLDSICERLDEEFGRMSGKHVLITGGAGFLGYYLVRALVHYNRKQATIGDRTPITLTVYDNYLRGRASWLSKLAERSELSLVMHDITEPLPADAPPFQFVLHAASVASPIFYRQHPLATMDANVLGLRRLLDHCRDQAASGEPIEGFLFFSTSEIYGDPTADNIPTSETYAGNVSCTGPRACYDESKRFGETLCVTFHAQYGVPVRIVRPFNNYGPGLEIDDGRVLSDFAAQVLAGRDIVMFSDGSPTRTFCYVADAVVGYYKTLIHGGGGEAYNIGNDRPEISIAELAERVVGQARRLFNYPGRVVRGVHEDRDYLIDNPSRRCPTIDKARAELGFEPAVSLDDGLKRTLLWYASQ